MKYIHEILLAIALFLGGVGVDIMKDISKETSEIKIHLATIVEKITQHEARIQKLEDERAYLRRLAKP